MDISMKEQLEQAKRFLLFGDTSSAKRLYNKILKEKPRNLESLHGISLAFFQEKKYRESEKFLLEALAIKEEDPELHRSLGIVYQNEYEWEKAAKSLEKAKYYFENTPTYEKTAKLVNVGNLLAGIYIKQQKLLEAKEVLKKNLKMMPDNVDTLKMLAQVYIGLLQYYHAIETLEKLPISRSVLEALKVEVFLLKKDHRNALKSAKQCIKLDPSNAEYFCLLGECYIKTLELEKSIESFKKGLELAPYHCKMLGRLLALQVRVCDWIGREEVIQRLRALCAADKTGECLSVIQPTIAILSGFTNEEIQQVAEARCKVIESVAAPVRQEMHFSYKRKKEKKLKIGYLSSDFHNHATAHLMLDVFGLHNREKFEIFAYSYGKNDRSHFRKKIEGDCDHFLEIGEMSDTKVAQKVNHDHIDILIDLKGHIVDHRLGICALRPSPIQVHYLGYPGTIGASFIDYLIADSYLIPKSEREYYTESVVYMPISYQANTSRKTIQKNKPTRKEYGIPEDAFVFCCFNQNDKFDVDTVEAWMKILQKLPHSILWLWGNYHDLKNKITSYGKEWGIDEDRFVVSPTEPSPKHLARMRLADLFLDTFYYNAHTSCSDAIRVGLPVLTCPGKTFASRVAASLLKNVRATELIAKDCDGYIAIAIELAKNPKKLMRIQDKINRNRDASHLYDPALFTKYLDEAYLTMWEHYMAGKPPKDIFIL